MTPADNGECRVADDTSYVQSPIDSSDESCPFRLYTFLEREHGMAAYFGNKSPGRPVDCTQIPDPNRMYSPDNRQPVTDNLERKRTGNW